VPGGVIGGFGVGGIGRGGNPYFNPGHGGLPKIIGDPDMARDPLRIGGPRGGPFMGGPPGNLVGPNS